MSDDGEDDMSQWLFGPDSMMWKVNRESVLLFGGRASLLMQIAHPLVAEGVNGHSHYRADPFGRLRRTLDTMLSITFGDHETAARMMRRVNGVHGRVVGTAQDGRSYSARDPLLAKWVYSTLVYSSVSVYEACVQRLTEDEQRRHYTETKVVARMFGIPDEMLPAERAELFDWMKELIDSGEVTVTPLARELAAPILNPIPLFPRRMAEASAFITAAILPRKLREGYGLKVGWSRSKMLAMGRWASRAALPFMPRTVRTLPAARLAEARVAAPV